MKSTHSRTKTIAAEEIARLADKGEDVSRFFTGSGRMMMCLKPGRSGSGLMPARFS